MGCKRTGRRGARARHGTRQGIGDQRLRSNRRGCVNRPTQAIIQIRTQQSGDPAPPPGFPGMAQGWQLTQRQDFPERAHLLLRNPGGQPFFGWNRTMPEPSAGGWIFQGDPRGQSGWIHALKRDRRIFQRHLTGIDHAGQEQRKQAQYRGKQPEHATATARRAFRLAHPTWRTTRSH